MDEQLKDILEIIKEAKAENIALQAICAVLICEIAVLHSQPREKMDQITVSLQGVAHAVASQMENPGATQAMSKLFERVSEMAETALQVRPAQT